MASVFSSWCWGCCATRTFAVRAVLGTRRRGEHEDVEVRGRCVECRAYRDGIVAKEVNDERRREDSG